MLQRLNRRAVLQVQRSGLLALPSRQFTSRMNWSSIVEGTTAGVVAAALLALFALLRYRVGDWIFRWRLWRDLKNFGFGWRPRYGLTVGIRNWVGKSFTVRSVVVVTDKDHYLAMLMKDVMSISPVEMPAIECTPCLASRDRAWRRRGVCRPHARCNCVPHYRSLIAQRNAPFHEQPAR